MVRRRGSGETKGDAMRPSGSRRVLAGVWRAAENGETTAREHLVNGLNLAHLLSQCKYSRNEVLGQHLPKSYSYGLIGLLSSFLFLFLDCYFLFFWETVVFI